MPLSNLLDYSYQELLSVLTGRIRQPSYRCIQIFQAFYQQGIPDFAGMTTLPVNLRLALADLLRIGVPVLAEKRVAADRTAKYLWVFDDGQRAETVLVHEGDRRTACFSSQAGCALGCIFCATGRGGFRRGLSAGEITGQVWAVQKDSGRRVTNCVAMGQGEPLLNYEAVLKALYLLNDPNAFGIGWRHLTLSTAGIVPAIYRLADDDVPCGLAVSLHAPDDGLRSELMPVNRKYPLGDLKKACLYYNKKTGRRITFEYVLLDGVNDRQAEAKALAAYCRGILCHLNLIPFNPVEDCPWKRPSGKRVDRFFRMLNDLGLDVFIRVEKGAEIEAACGQLAQRSE
ncbi:MAG: 23S rRNA (adenine(2503)-C(2))-methyltransferase RlmN [Bacillota bacterium]